jgi:hypothetical protein
MLSGFFWSFLGSVVGSLLHQYHAGPNPTPKQLRIALYKTTLQLGILWAIVTLFLISVV